MKRSVQIADYALRTLAAKKESSVVSVYEGTVAKVAEALDRGEHAYYIGVKNTDVISYDFRKMLESKNMFVHTLDQMSAGGRAVDLDLINPITGRFMTGSSSGTALNVFRGINDLGVGTDGGGSVLAPALSLNLYAMISPLFDQPALRKYSKKSTDGIMFSPAIGFITKEHKMMEILIRTLFKEQVSQEFHVCFAPSMIPGHRILYHTFKAMDLDFKEVDLSYEGLDRTKMMAELKTFDFEKNILITCEGPIDLLEYGDSVMGSYDDITHAKQTQGHKYYLKVVNMSGLSAFAVPTTNHARGYLVICKSDPAAIYCALKNVCKFKFERLELENSYFDCQKKIREDVL